MYNAVYLYGQAVLSEFLTTTQFRVDHLLDVCFHHIWICGTYRCELLDSEPSIKFPIKKSKLWLYLG
jgi:hypothetical protein